jgi:hypothetical protein
MPALSGPGQGVSKALLPARVECMRKSIADVYHSRFGMARECEDNFMLPHPLMEMFRAHHEPLSMAPKVCNLRQANETACRSTGKVQLQSTRLYLRPSLPGWFFWGSRKAFSIHKSRLESGA